MFEVLPSEVIFTIQSQEFEEFLKLPVVKIIEQYL
jgi:hypothetical protein